MSAADGLGRRTGPGVALPGMWRAPLWGLLATLLVGCEALAPAPDEPVEQLPPSVVLIPDCDCPEPVTCPEPEPPACPEPVRVVPPPVDAPDTLGGKMVLGAVEYVQIQPGGLRLRARIDSGATTSSLHAEEIVRFERDGQPWVRFRTYARDDARELQTLELPVSRRVRIKTLTDEVDQRPVVEVQVRLGSHSDRVEVTLVDRGNFAYAVLIGRNFLRDVAVIDVGREFIQGR